MRGRAFVLAGLPIAMIALGGCEKAIEKYNPAEPRAGAQQYSTPKAEPPPELTRAKAVKIDLRVDEHFEPDDQIILVNQSDGAVYGLELTVNHDYHLAVPLIEMGDTIRLPESWLKTRQGRPFPSERRVRMERVEVRFEGRLVAFFDARGNPPPSQ